MYKYIEMENFKLSEMKTLCKTEDKNLAAAKVYLTKYFIPLTSGQHVVFHDNEYSVVEESVVRRVYFNRMDKRITAFYFKEFDGIRTIDCELNKPVFYGNKINLCPRLLHQGPRPKSFSKATNDGVKLMLNLVRDILASGNTDMYNFLLKWFACVCQGKKNQSILYFKSIEGVGKSTFTDFFRFKVIGPHLSLMTGSEPVKSRFNSALAGKLLVIFEELENFGTNEWKAISSRLKRWATGSTYDIEKKGMDSYTITNINNYIVNCNVDSLKDADGRRYCIPDISTHRKGDSKYWTHVYTSCNNKDVGEAFFYYLLDIDTTGFDSQNFPSSVNKSDSFADRMPMVYRFIKDEFILKHYSINCKVNELYGNFEDYCDKDHTFNAPAIKKTVFCRFLRDVNIDFRKTNGHNRYVFDEKDLLVTARKHKWIHELDEYVEEIVADDATIEFQGHFGGVLNHNRTPKTHTEEGTKVKQPKKLTKMSKEKKKVSTSHKSKDFNFTDLEFDEIVVDFT